MAFTTTTDVVLTHLVPEMVPSMVSFTLASFAWLVFYTKRSIVGCKWSLGQSTTAKDSKGLGVGCHHRLVCLWMVVERRVRDAARLHESQGSIQPLLHAGPEGNLVNGNRPQNDQNWNNPEFETTASMSRFHKFVTLPTKYWRHFNVLTFQQLRNPGYAGLDAGTGVPGGRKEGTEEDVLLYFHVFPFNSVQSIHPRFGRKELGSRV